jgi:CheY-like chemotaxis protein
MGGGVCVESEVGRGSAFYVTARFELAAEESLVDFTRVAEDLSGLRVLVVDDNATNRRILHEILRTWDMLPSCASGAEQALQMMRQAHAAGRPFQMVLTDSQMPDVDGFSLATQIRQDKEVGETAIMMLTSGDKPGDVARCQGLNISAHMLKPVKQSELLNAMLRSLLGRVLPKEAQEADTPAVQIEIPPLRILLAEDSVVNQKLAVALLEKHGHQVHVANNGEEAVSTLDSQEFDLVLMDVQMPEMDGYEATEVIRGRERKTGKHIPIIAMTAHAMEGDRERCLDAGMDGYVPKPIRARELFAVIDSVCSARLDLKTAPDHTTCRTQDVLDWNEALHSVGGDRELLRTVAEAVIDEAPRMMDAIRRSVRHSDSPGLQSAAHLLKGSIRYFGAKRAFLQALRLEGLGRDGSLEEAPEALAALELEMARLLPALESLESAAETQE